MADEEFWIQLYVGEEKSGEVILIEIASLYKNRIHYLKNAVHQGNSKSLGHCDAANLVVYKAGTEFPLKEEDKLSPGKPVPEGTSEENPLLVVAPAIIVKEQEDVLTELKDFMKQTRATLNLQQEGFRAVIESMKQTRATPSPSPAQYGDHVLEMAEANGTYTIFQGEAEAEAALSPGTLESLAACRNEWRNEHRLVALLTSPLEDIFGNSVCLVNSEEHAWLQTSYEWLQTSEPPQKKYNQKPDLFLCCEEIYTVKRAWKPKQEIPERKDAHRFGILSDWSLRDCIAATFEAKLTINNQAIGEAVNYGNHIVYGNDAPNVAKIVLFDTKKFLLLEVRPRNSVKITECEWEKGGSKKLLHDFPLYQNNWTMLVKEACEKWQLEIARDGKGSAWLGRGGYGRVFRVKKIGSKKQMALKVVQKTKWNIAALSMEKKMLREAAHCGFVMPIERTQEDLGWALLMSYVGSPVEESQYEDVIKLLAALHNKGFLHGDPRLANVVAFNDKLYWIDFMAVRRSPTAEAKVEEMKKLVANILHPTVMEECEALDKYDGSIDAVQAVIKACAKYRKKDSS